jgi:hypothetical protein
MAPSTYFFHNFEQQDRFSQNSTDIMKLEATTNALKSSRGAVIITRYKHKFSLNTTLILFQSLSYMFRSWTQIITKLRSKTVCNKTE